MRTLYIYLVLFVALSSASYLIYKSIFSGLSIIRSSFIGV